MRRTAFSLMELLVVISIIALLASLVIPAISMVRNSAKDLTCRAHLRQVQLGALGYAADQDGMAVPARTSWETFWHVYLAPYVEAEGTSAPGYATNKIRQTSSVIWGCPNRRLNGNMNQTWAPGYGINMWLMEPQRDAASGWSYGNGYEEPGPSTNSWYGVYRDFPIASISNTSQRAWWGEGTSWTIDFSDEIYPIGLPMYRQYRHQNHGNTMFVDGHVQAMKNTPNAWETVNDPSLFQE